MVSKGSIYIGAPLMGPRLEDPGDAAGIGTPPTSGEKMSPRATTAQKIRKEEYEWNKQQVVEWIEDLLQEFHGDQSVEDWFRDGTVLCKLANVIRPGSIDRMISDFGSSPAMRSARMRANITQFTTALSKLGVPGVFEVNDLYESKDLEKVVLCLYTLGYMVPDICPDFSGRHIVLRTQRGRLGVAKMDMSGRPSLDKPGGRPSVDRLLKPLTADSARPSLDAVGGRPSLDALLTPQSPQSPQDKHEPAMICTEAQDRLAQLQEAANIVEEQRRAAEACIRAERLKADLAESKVLDLTAQLEQSEALRVTAEDRQAAAQTTPSESVDLEAKLRDCQAARESAEKAESELVVLRSAMTKLESKVRESDVARLSDEEKRRQRIEAENKVLAQRVAELEAWAYEGGYSSYSSPDKPQEKRFVCVACCIER